MASIIMTAEYVHAGMSSLSISAASHCTSELRIRVRVISRIDVTLSEGQGGQGMVGASHDPGGQAGRVAGASHERGRIRWGRNGVERGPPSILAVLAHRSMTE